MMLAVKKKKPSQKKSGGLDYVPEWEEQAEQANGAKIKELKKKLKECCLEKEKRLADWQRAQADLINYRNRQEKLTEEKLRLNAVAILASFLPLYDSLQKGADKNKDIAPLKKQIEAIFKGFKVEKIEAAGKKFDYQWHEVVSQVESDKEPGTILEEVQTGYVFEGKLLRPSKVVVAK